MNSPVRHLDGFEAASHTALTATIAQYARATRGELEHYLSTTTPAPFLDDLIADYPSRGGKMLRPAICIATAKAFGGALEPAVRCAAAIEILHNGLLIHDDIQDGSELRRGKPTLHALHGVPLAINAGDAMMFTALRPLIDAVRPYGADVARKILDASMTMARETAEGQALELGWRDRNIMALDESDYLRMALKKTAWMGMIWPAQLGLLLGSGGRADPDTVIRFGYFLGVAFQIEDDLRNLSTDPGYGKEQNGDLFEAKRTLMLIHARQHCSDGERARLDGFLAQGRAERCDDDVLWLANVMEERGSIAYARSVAGAMAGAATHEFSLAYGHLPPSSDLNFIADLIPWIFMRS